MVGVTDALSSLFFDEVRAASAVIRTEFPNFQILSAMSVFSLTPGNRQGHGSFAVADGDSFKERMARLASFLAVDEQELFCQFEAVRQQAQAIKDQEPNISNLSAWRKGLRLHGRRPGGALVKVLAAWGAWRPSSRGVEQHVAQLQRSHGDRMSCIGDRGLRDLLTLAVETRTKKRDARIVGLAQLIYIKYFGGHRRFFPGKHRRKAATTRTCGIFCSATCGGQGLAEGRAEGVDLRKQHWSPAPPALPDAKRQRRFLSATDRSTAAEQGVSCRHDDLWAVC